MRDGFCPFETLLEQWSEGREVDSCDTETRLEDTVESKLGALLEEMFSRTNAFNVAESNKRDDTSCCSQPEQEICPELCDAWHTEFPDGEDGQESHDPVGSCIKACMHITGRYDNLCDRYALVLDSAQEEFFWISTAECDDAKVDHAEDGADGHADVDDHSLPGFDDDS